MDPGGTASRADGTATLDGRTVDTRTGNTDTGTVTGTIDSANVERALLADAVTVAGRYGRQVRLYLTDPPARRSASSCTPTDRCTRRTPAGRGAVPVMHERR